MIFIDWNDLEVSKRLNDGDVINMSKEDLGDPSVSQFVLQLSPHKDWWKGLQLLDNTDAQIAFTEVQAPQREASSGLISQNDIAVGGKLVLWKAKTFGIHTPMYILADLERVAGQKVTLQWNAD